VNDHTSDDDTLDTSVEIPSAPLPETESAPSISGDFRDGNTMFTFGVWPAFGRPPKEFSVDLASLDGCRARFRLDAPLALRVANEIHRELSSKWWQGQRLFFVTPPQRALLSRRSRFPLLRSSHVLSVRASTDSDRIELSSVGGKSTPTLRLSMQLGVALELMGFYSEWRISLPTARDPRPALELTYGLEPAPKRRK